MPQFHALKVEVIIVSQLRENQGKIITIKAVKKNINSLRPSVKLYLYLINFIIIKINGKVKIIIPVGFVKKINPNEIPANEE